MKNLTNEHCIILVSTRRRICIYNFVVISFIKIKFNLRTPTRLVNGTGVKNEKTTP